MLAIIYSVIFIVCGTNNNNNNNNQLDPYLFNQPTEEPSNQNEWTIMALTLDDSTWAKKI